MSGLRLLITTGIVVAAAAGLGWAVLPRGEGLSELEQGIARSHPEIEHITPAAFDAWGRQDRPVIVLDVREEDEYAVSHLEGALRVSPQASADDVVALIGNGAQDADIVFYCSVGVRSSKLASRVADRLERAGAHRIANLSGGVFRWHNEARPLTVGNRPTEFVHPYDATWKRLVERKDLTAFDPETTAR